MRPAIRASRSQWTRFASAESAPASCRSVCVFCQHFTHTSQHSTSTRSFTSTSAHHARQPRVLLSQRPPDSPRSPVEAMKNFNPNEPPRRDSVFVGEDEEIEDVDETPAQQAKRERAEEREDRRARKREMVENAALHAEYRPQNEAKGMQRIGGKFNFPSSEKRAVYSGFIPSQKIQDPREIMHAVHRAAVEVFTASSLGKNMKSLDETGPEDLLASDARFIKLEPSEDGNGAVLHFPSEAVKAKFFDSLQGPSKSEMRERSEAAAAAEEAEIEEDLMAQNSKTSDTDGDPAEDEVAARSEETEDLLDDAELEADVIAPEAYAQMLKEGDFGPSWRAVPIADLKIRFHIARRVTALTGHVFPDVTLNRAQTLGGLTEHLHKKVTKPENVFESIVGKAAAENIDFRTYGSRGNAGRNMGSVNSDALSDLAQLPNVAISHRHVSMIDKERSMGRWKLIQDALHKQGLA